jgi:ABC-type transport system involved in multi-copper enzyme maturation permease subunit
MYLAWTSMAAFAMTVGSLFFVRRGAKIGEPTVLNRVFSLIRHQEAGERRRAPRNVWHNPVAWREAKTRASGGRGIRWLVIGAGAFGSMLLLIRYASGGLSADEARNWLAGLVAVQFAIALLIATNTAATSMTKEKEARTMDLLLSTPVTSKYIIWGKLRGLVSFAVPLLLVPTAASLAFGLLDFFQSGAREFWIESALQIAVLMTIFTACACVIGLKVSMTARKNVTAVMYSVGVVTLLCTVSWGLGYAIIRAIGREFAAFFAPFTPFTAALFLVNPSGLFETAKEFAEHVSATRIAASIGCAVAVTLYAFLVWTAYSGLVRGFDMTMRKQTGT